jgi:hypothetical protein
MLKILTYYPRNQSGTTFNSKNADDIMSVTYNLKFIRIFTNFITKDSIFMYIENMQLLFINAG